MGADLLIAWAPAPADDGTDWSPNWDTYVAALTDTELEDIADDMGEHDNDLRHARQRLHQAGRTLLTANRSIQWLPHGIAGGQPVYVTGGMSWGDTPTDSWDDIRWVAIANDYRQIPWTTTA